MIKQTFSLITAVATTLLFVGCGSNDPTGIEAEVTPLPINSVNTQTAWNSGQIPVAFAQGIAASDITTFMDSCNNNIGGLVQLSCVPRTSQQDFVLVHSDVTANAALQDVSFAYNYETLQAGNVGGLNPLFIASGQFNQHNVVSAIMATAHSTSSLPLLTSQGTLQTVAVQNITNFYPMRQGQRRPRPAGRPQGGGAIAAPTSFPTCTLGTASDPDGDGYGWEYNRTCIAPVTATPAAPTSMVAAVGNSNGRPVCISNVTDLDGDGFGFEGGQTCLVTSATTISTVNPAVITTLPACSPGTTSDPDGDGFGFENNQSCTVQATIQAMAMQCMSLPFCFTAGADPEGDGFGFENGSSCIVPNSPASMVGMIMHPACPDNATDVDGDGWGWVEAGANSFSCRLPGNNQVCD